MNREDIIRMAREAGWQYADGDDGYNPLWRFAALVAAAEREACAKVCEAEGHRIDAGWASCAFAIRARGQPTQADALNAWAADRLARHGIPMPCPDCGGIGYDASGQLCGCQS